MKPPVATSMRQGDHGPQARSNCKKIRPQHAQTSKHEHFLKAENHRRSKPWEFFTDDYAAHGASLQTTTLRTPLETAGSAPSDMEGLTQSQEARLVKGLAERRVRVGRAC